MDKLKKYLIRGISILMASLLLVMSPLSDYADTQGIGETHAMGSGGIIPLITGSSLISFLGWALGVGITVAGASYIYDEYKEYVYYGGDTDLISIVDNLTEGVSELKITDKLINSFASFLENVKGLDLDSGTQTFAYGTGAIEWNYATDNAYYNSFMNYYETVAEPNDYMIEFIGTEVRVWTFDYFYSGTILGTASDNVFYKENCVSCLYGNPYQSGVSGGTNFCYYGVAYYSSSEGLLVGYSYDIYSYYHSFTYTADGWVDNGITSRSGAYYPAHNALATNTMSLKPLYKFADVLGSPPTTLSSFLDNCAYKDDAQATSYGGYDTANIETLVSATVTGNQVDAVSSSVSTAFPQQDSSELTEEQRAALVAALVAQALAEADIASGGNQEPDDDDNNNDDNQGEVENPNLVAPPITPPEYGEDLEVGNEITVGDQAIIDQSVTNTNGIITGLNNIVSSIGNIADGIGDVLANPLGAIKTAIDSVAESVWDFFANPIGNIIELIGDILSAILSLPSMIITGLLKPLLTELFVPDTEGLMERISILAPVVSIIDTLGKFFNCFSLINGSEPPYMYIHFENAEDERFQSIGTLKILDMAWYEPYKPYGDLIFSCVIWLFLMLRIFKAIPSILNGMSGGGELSDSTYEPYAQEYFPKIETRGFTMKQ